MGFIGEFNHTVDTKGRVVVPSGFREQLGEEFIVTRGLEHCLYAYHPEEWTRVEQSLSELPSSKENRKLSRFFLSGAVRCEVDKQGRILLPSVLREYAQIDKDAVLVGNNRHMEIWDKDAWTDYNDYDNVEEIAEKVADRLNL